ncbi:MAG TPA: Gfo/Idh/MocA family oxidoreductase [Anaerolineaceae bacterium]
MTRKRYAQVGLGSRSEMYTIALTEYFFERHELVGLCDTNQGRLEQRLQKVKAAGGDARGYLAGQFDQMLAECKPDTVIVTTQDSFHDEFICRALEAGCDVITEKPMTTTAEKCQRIIDTQQRTGKQVKVTFNYRYSPPRTQVKDLLMSGVIGEVISVDFHWLLDTRHGADYYRRWHRNKANSGGLMVHKATHHFDLVNWWLSTIPVKVYASGARKFYTPETADRYGLTRRGERCYGCAEAGRCPFLLDISQGPLRAMYLDQEQYDGYYRDRCIFSPEIDIEDTMNLVVDYENNVKMTYSLNSYMPWEGYIVNFNGSRGRLEHKAQETVYVSGDGSVPGALKHEGTTIHIFPHFKPAYAVDIWQAKGGHGGGDILMLKDIFEPESSSDPYFRAADQRSGAYSILTGVAANLSMATGQAVSIADLVKGVERPDYPPMPSSTDPLPLP